MPPSTFRPCPPPAAFLLLIPLLLLLSLSPLHAADAKTTYADHVRPILQARCFSCHNPDKKKGGLDVTSYAGLLAGGSGGATVDAGNPSGSRLWKVTAKKEEPFMPPDGDPLKPAELDTLARWIDAGLLETTASVARKSDKPKLDLVITSTGKPDGPPPMPGDVLREPVLVPARADAVTALAASPWAPLLAVSGARQVVLYQADTLDVAGILPYPEGVLCSLRFSRNGALLIAAGGHGAKAGNVVLFDVITGRRVAETGSELDTILAADLRARPAMIAFGTTGRKLKVFEPGGAELYAKGKHSEWVTAVGFSPDGVLLASGDRNGGVRVWESDTGAEYLNLEGHRGAITALAWRPDGNVLASASEDGDVILWEMNGGAQVKRWTAHGGGSLCVDYSADGRLVTAGRDRHVRTWAGDGAALKDLGETPDLPTRVAWLHDNARVAAGVWNGSVIFWKADTGERLGTTTQTPPDLATRLAAAEKQVASLEAPARAADEAHTAAAAALAASSDARAALQKQAGEARTRMDQLKQELAGLEQRAAELDQKAAALEPEIETRRKEAEARLAARQQAASALDAQQRRIALLKADQFNVGVLAAEARLAELEREAAALAAALEAARADQSARHQQLDDCRQELARLEPQLPALDTAVEKQTAEAARLDAALAQARTELSARESADAGAHQTQAAREADVAAARKRVDDLETESASARETLGRATADRDAARARHKACTETLPGLEAAATAADQSVTSATPPAETAAKARDARRATVETLRAQHRALVPR